MHIRQGDKVQVIAGKEKGKVGRVLRIDHKRNRVVVESINIVKRHQKPTAIDPEGGIIEKEAPLHVSNVLLYSEELERGVRVSYRFVGANGEHHESRNAALATFSDKPARVAKVRVCKRTGEVFKVEGAQ
ncbi:50S ribosomal protein L24 [Myxococcota bacterium]|nr:50S ribosomal protein L24 [Myxococcota bacterium]MBU1430962.1 50S ribosomal protein L24 [Myxococcota bacterium]MBU1897243.1 50S ribosomal protein L24 [Myxococcota bacterium]